VKLGRSPGGFKVRFPTTTPTEADLTYHLIDPNLKDAEVRTAALRNFFATGGTVKGWSHQVGDTQYSIRVQRPSKVSKESYDDFMNLVDSNVQFGSGLTNLPFIEERKTDIDGFRGRMFLSSLPSDICVFTYVFFTKIRGVCLSIERPGESLTDDQTAQGFIRSVEVRER
jgi:hypothetical protein